MDNNQQNTGQNTNTYSQYNQQTTQQTGYDPNAYTYGQYGQQAGYDQNAYAYGQYGQQAGYDPNAYTYSQYGQQAGYDQNAYSQYGQYNQYGQQASYDPNAYAAYYAQQSNNNDPNSPLRLNVSPSNPSTSSNNITLNLDSLYEKINNEINKTNETLDGEKEMKDFFLYLTQSYSTVEIFSYLTDIESSIGKGMINSVNNNTISVDSKVIALKYISYIQFASQVIDDNGIRNYFYNNFMQKNIQNQNSNLNNRNQPPSDFFNFLQSRKSFNQYVNIVVSSSFLMAIEKLNVVELNEHIAILKSEDKYYMIPIDKIVTME
ncbi:MAG: hypothetical protein ACRC92_25455 [Peptostreptococcaceae bacterium]